MDPTVPPRPDLNPLRLLKVVDPRSSARIPRSPSPCPEVSIIVPAPVAVARFVNACVEPAHAIGWLAREAGHAVPSGSTVLLTLSGRGDKDAAQIAERLTGERIA